jgi:2-aminophenol/2-amino-5-chlorophenol 1,6-dioxygenase alpha subunit
MNGELIGALIVPGLPQPLLCPEANAGWQRVHDAYKAARALIDELKPDRLVLYSTQWHSIIGHQLLTDPNPKWALVDEEFHALGTMHYSLNIDADLGEETVKAAQARGLTARGVNYYGFPVDTGSVVALSLLDPEGTLPASLVSRNVYADRSETVVLGKATRDAVLASGKRTVAIAITGLSYRLHTEDVPPAEDHIHSRKDDEWNRKILDILASGRLEDVSQLARTFSSQANADARFKALWWLSAVMGEHNGFKGTVHAYEPIFGTGAAVVSLIPTQVSTGDLEYDEDNTETYKGDRNVLTVES